MRRPLLLAALGLALAACKPAAPPAADSVVDSPASPPPPAAAPAPAKPYSEAITAADFSAHLKALSSDEFEGRGPGSIGERATVAYLEDQFKQLGLKPGNGESWVQTVPMVETRADPATTLQLTVKGQPRTLAFGEQMVVGTRTTKPEVTLENAPLVFAGYGVNAPEAGWNDYEGLDVKGKVVVVLVNDPGFIRKDPELFKGQTMTYYGRWTYKFEEAARQGAAGVLIVHETEAAAYGWEVIRNGWSGPQFDLPPEEDTDPRMPIQGWITTETATKLFADAGLDFESLRQAADQRGFKAVPLDATLSVNLKSTVRRATSDNVLALLPGTTRKDEAVVYMGHWDHLGHAEGPADTDTIFNGAIDNATGVAGALSIARAFAAQQPPPERSILFLIPTLEESGLLGSRYYANHPVLPLKKTVGVINMDALPIQGRARDMGLVGSGQSDLEELLASVIEPQGRVIGAEESPEKGYYFRSDHFNFARKGVPALYAKGGNDLLEGGTEAGKAAAADYVANRYHKPADEFDPNWNYDGVIEDLNALYEVGHRIAAGDTRPQWKDGSEFKAAGEALHKAP
jgi:Zn-dependent M28 family amino/carboxypeptidase